jgi:hypothetical protein
VKSASRNYQSRTRKRSTVASATKTSPSAYSHWAGSSQFRSKAAFRLEPATVRASMSLAVFVNAPRGFRAITPKAFRRACPNKLEVSSTRLAPHNGLLSSAARKGQAPKPPVSLATSIVRSISRRSMFVSMGQGPQKVHTRAEACHREGAQVSSKNIDIGMLTSLSKRVPMYTCYSYH